MRVFECTWTTDAVAQSLETFYILKCKTHKVTWRAGGILMCAALDISKDCIKMALLAETFRWVEYIGVSKIYFTVCRCWFFNQLQFALTSSCYYSSSYSERWSWNQAALAHCRKHLGAQCLILMMVTTSSIDCPPHHTAMR